MGNYKYNLSDKNVFLDDNLSDFKTKLKSGLTDVRSKKVLKRVALVAVGTVGTKYLSDAVNEMASKATTSVLVGNILGVVSGVITTGALLGYNQEDLGIGAAATTISNCLTLIVNSLGTN